MNNILNISMYILIATFVTSCCLFGKVSRDGATYTAEVISSLKRQEYAAIELIRAATISNGVGNFESCSRYAGPALLIEAKARHQAYRALWLAGLPYPYEDGTLPDEGEEQPDPGASPDPEPVTSICKSGEQ